MVHACNTEFKNDLPRPVNLDANSFKIKVDNCATRCTSNCVDDFVGPMQSIQKQHVKGAVGSTTADIAIGAMRWNIEDDMGRQHATHLPD